MTDHPEPATGSEDLTAPAASAEPSRPIRLSILHLFFWMTAAAILLAVNRTLPVMSQLSEFQKQYYLTLVFISSIAEGISLASLGVLCQYGFRQPALFPRQPGHWILLSAGLTTLTRIIIYVSFPLTPLVEEQDWTGLGYYWLRLVIAQSIVSAVVQLTAWFSLQRPGWHWIFMIDAMWNLVTVVLCLGMVLPRDGYLSASLEQALYWEPIVFCGLVWIQQRIDWNRPASDDQPQKDWLHYLGVIVVIEMALRGMALIAWPYLTQQ